MKYSLLMLGGVLVLATALTGSTMTAITSPVMLNGQPPASKHVIEGVHGLPADATQHCGVERVAVKNLLDSSVREIHFAPQQTTIHALREPEQPKDLRTINPYLRLEAEKQVYAVQALLIGFKREADGDYHLVLADPVDHKKTIIAEIPSPKCANKKYAAQFEAAATFIESITHATPAFKTLDKPVAVTVTGVFFFDFIHGQTGVAPNGAELHPVLEIK